MKKAKIRTVVKKIIKIQKVPAEITNKQKREILSTYVISDRQKKEIVQQHVDSLVKDLKKNGRIRIKGLGIIRVVRRTKPAVKAGLKKINPFTKQEYITVAKPARKVTKYKFICSKNVKDLIR